MIELVHIQQFFFSICAGRRIQFEPKRWAEICSTRRYHPAPPTVARTLYMYIYISHSKGVWNSMFIV